MEDMNKFDIITLKAELYELFITINKLRNLIKEKENMLAKLSIETQNIKPIKKNTKNEK